MRIMIGILTKLVVISALICFLNGISNASVQRRIIIEDHTNASNGLCVLGNQALEDLFLQYGDKFIPVAFHVGDKMCVGNEKTIQSSVSTALGWTGAFPNGTLNRMTVLANGQNTIFHSPVFWQQTVATHLADQSDVDVTVEWNLDKITKILTATVKAKMEADYNGQLAFNLYILEDGQTGTGTGWDQKNTLSANSLYKNHPYYSKPNPITNYKHQNVFIDAIGGAWGDTTGFPNPAMNGQTYVRKFDVDLSGYPIQNLDNLWFVGLVQETGTSKQILNSVSVNKKMPKPKLILTASQDKYYLSGLRKKTTSLQVSFKNESSWDAIVDFSIDSTKSSMPKGWQVKPNQAQVTIKAGAEVSVGIDFILDKTVAYGFALLKASVQNGTEFDGEASSVTLGLLTDGVENIFYELDDYGIIPIKGALYNHPTFALNSAFIPLTPETYAAYPRDKFKLALFPETFTSKMSLVNTGNDQFLAIANEFIDAGKPIYISSNNDLFYIALNSQSIIPSQQTIDLFRKKLFINGFTLVTPFKVASSSNFPTAITLTGSDGDDISDGLDFAINEYDQIKNPFYTYYIDQINCEDTKNVKTFLTWVSENMMQEQKIAAVKILTGKGKAVYTGFSLDLIADQVMRTTLLGNIITWLLNPSSVDEPVSNPNSAKITVYPNPAVSSFKIHFENNKISSTGLVYISNSNGQNIKTVSSSLISGSNEFNVTTVGLPSGNYYIITVIDGIMSHHAFVITK